MKEPRFGEPLEVLAVGRLRYDALVPCLVASIVGDWTCQSWGLHPSHYVIRNVPLGAAGLDVNWEPLVTASLVGKVLIASLAFALASVLFAELTHAIGWVFRTVISWGSGRPFVGGLIVLALVWAAGTRDYLGLGLPMIVGSFEPAGVATFAFAWKILFTAVTLGSGFKGGEVTPLFFIGAALGCTLGHVLGVPTDVMAALGFVAVFAAAANTPLACTVMGIELFGAQYGVYIALACCSAYVWSGHRGIYPSQVIDTPKSDDPHAHVDMTLNQTREARGSLRVALLALADTRTRRNPTPSSTNGELGMPPTVN